MPCAPAPGPSSAGATVVGGSWLPPAISAVFASDVEAGGGVPTSPGSLSCGANTVAGSGTERSSPASPLVSVPAHGVAPSGAPGTASRTSWPPTAAGHGVSPPEEAGEAGGAEETEGAPEAGGAAKAAGAAEADASATGREPAPSDTPEDGPAAPPP